MDVLRNRLQSTKKLGDYDLEIICYNSEKIKAQKYAKDTNNHL